MRIIPYFMNKFAADALTAWLSLFLKLPRQDVKEGVLTLYVHCSNHLFELYVTYDTLAGTDNDNVRFTRSPIMSSLDIPNRLWMKMLGSLPINDEYMIGCTFIEGFSHSLLHSMHFHQIRHEDTSKQKFGYKVPSSCKVQTAA